MFIFLFFINILTSLVSLIYLKKSNRTPETKIRLLRTILNVKPFVYFPCIITLALFLSSFRMRILALLIPLYIVFLILLDASIFFKLAIQLREGKISFSEYLKSTLLDTLIIILPLILVVVLKVIFPKLISSPVYVVAAVIIAYNIGLPYIQKLKYKECERFEIDYPENVKSKQFRLFKYEGTTAKEANAMACGIFPPYHIYVSDYLLDHLTEGEMRAVLLHEIGHIKKHHFLIKNLYLVGLYPLLTLVGWLLDQYFSSISMAGGMTVMFLVMIVFGAGIFLLISRLQEYSADKFAVTALRDKSQFISALNKIKELNMSANKVTKGEELLSTHPSFSKRIGAIQKINF